MAKGMGNGFPIGAIAIAPHIHPKHGMLGTTFGGNHLACAAALAVLEVMQQEDLMNHATQVGDYLIEALKLQAGINNVRGKGLMIGFDVADEYKSLRNVLLDEYHIFTGVAKPNVIRLLPALNLSKNEANDFLTAVKSATSLLPA